MRRRCHYDLRPDREGSYGFALVPFLAEDQQRAVDAVVAASAALAALVEATTQEMMDDVPIEDTWRAMEKRVDDPRGASYRGPSSVMGALISIAACAKVKAKRPTSATGSGSPIPVDSRTR